MSRVAKIVESRGIPSMMAKAMMECLFEVESEMVHVHNFNWFGRKNSLLTYLFRDEGISDVWFLKGNHDFLTFIDASLQANDCNDLRKFGHSKHIYTGYEVSIGRNRHELKIVMDDYDNSDLRIHTEFLPDYLFDYMEDITKDSEYPWVLDIEQKQELKNILRDYVKDRLKIMLISYIMTRDLNTDKNMETDEVRKKFRSLLEQYPDICKEVMTEKTVE